MYSGIFLNIRTVHKYYNLLFSSFNFWNTKGHVIVQNLIIVYGYHTAIYGSYDPEVW